MTGTSSCDDILGLSTAYCALVCTYICVFVYVLIRGLSTVHTHNPLPACQLLAPLKVFLFVMSLLVSLFMDLELMMLLFKVSPQGTKTHKLC